MFLVQQITRFGAILIFDCLEKQQNRNVILNVQMGFCVGKCMKCFSKKVIKIQHFQKLWDIGRKIVEASKAIKGLGRFSPLHSFTIFLKMSKKFWALVFATLLMCFVNFVSVVSQFLEMLYFQNLFWKAFHPLSNTEAYLKIENDVSILLFFETVKTK